MTDIADNAPTLRRRGPFGSNAADRLFQWGTLLMALAVPVIILALWFVLTRDAQPAISHFGWRFLTRAAWDPVAVDYGLLFAIFGTVASSLLALLIAVPISLGTALFLTELAPRWLRNPASFLIELLAAVPSIVYGLWGLKVLVPALTPVERWLGAHLGFLPIFQGEPIGFGMLAAGLVLAIMILPYITSVSREVILGVPRSQHEASLALGATRWETLRGPVLRYARSGILGAVILGLGRAMGETMAVTMVIGNTETISASLFSPGSTLTSLLANKFQEATEPLHTEALVGAALVLLGITIIVNAGARLLIWSVSRGQPKGVQE